MGKSAEVMKKHLEKNRDMPWPQVLSDQVGQESLAGRYGVYSVPTMLPIDKQGIPRTIMARHNAEDMIPKLLEK
jgi:hypothetical protein